MKKLLLSLALGFAFAGMLLAAAPSVAAQRPNILFILADDIGINGFGCYGSDRFKGHTSNIDALAASGVRFEQGYSMPTCNRSRYRRVKDRMVHRLENVDGSGYTWTNDRDASRVVWLLKDAVSPGGRRGKAGGAYSRNPGDPTMASPSASRAAWEGVDKLFHQIYDRAI